MRSLVCPADVFGDWSQQLLQERDVPLVAGTLAQSVFPRVQVAERCGPRHVVPLVQKVKGQFKWHGSVQLACLAKRERVVDEVSTIRRAELGVIVQQGSNDRRPHLLRIGHAIESALIHVALYVFHVGGYFERH